MKSRTLQFFKLNLIIILFLTGCKKDEDTGVDFISAYQGSDYSGSVSAVYNLAGEPNPMNFNGLATFKLKDIQGDDVKLNFSNNITNIEPFVLEYPGRQQGRSWVLQLSGIQGTLTVDESGKISGTAADSDIEHRFNGNISRKNLQLEIIIRYLNDVDEFEAGSVIQLNYTLSR